LNIAKAEDQKTKNELSEANQKQTETQAELKVHDLEGVITNLTIEFGLYP
jgi:hypothetical protein